MSKKSEKAKKEAGAKKAGSKGSGDCCCGCGPPLRAK